jgi:hypothetical protein
LPPRFRRKLEAKRVVDPGDRSNRIGDKRAIRDVRQPQRKGRIIRDSDHAPHPFLPVVGHFAADLPPVNCRREGRAQEFGQACGGDKHVARIRCTSTSMASGNTRVSASNENTCSGDFRIQRRGASPGP